MNMIASTKSKEISARLKDSEAFGYGFATVQNPPWTIEHILAGCKGTLICGGATTAFHSITTDSRNIKPGDVFLALKGENFDGNNFIPETIKRGVACVITDTMPKKKIAVPCVLVDDSLKALGDLAAYRRSLLKDLVVLAITGSSGKTSVKEMLAAILSQSKPLIKTKGNFNNLIGLPLSLMPVSYRHKFAVLEMGMNRPGEIARLTEIAKPDIACILNVHGAHLEGLGSIEGVASAKGELFAKCDRGATLIVNLDDKRVMALAEKKEAQKITFGCRKGAYVRATKVFNRGEAGMAFTLHIGAEKGRVSIKAVGRHNVSNSLAAAAMAHAAGVGFVEIVCGLEKFESKDKRFEVESQSDGLKLINDCYNANPASMTAALEAVRGMKKDVKTIAVLGDMLELGLHSVTAHREVGRKVVSNDFDHLLTVGEFAAEMVDAARKAGMADECACYFSSKEELQKKLADLLKKQVIGPGDIILFKGSRGMRMETLIESLKK